MTTAIFLCLPVHTSCNCTPSLFLQAEATHPVIQEVALALVSEEGEQPPRVRKWTTGASRASDRPVMEQQGGLRFATQAAGTVEGERVSCELALGCTFSELVQSMCFPPRTTNGRADDAELAFTLPFSSPLLPLSPVS